VGRGRRKIMTWCIDGEGVGGKKEGGGGEGKKAGGGGRASKRRRGVKKRINSDKKGWALILFLGRSLFSGFDEEVG